MKKCFKCGVEKENSQFYVHKKMADGILGKCKDCTKSDSKNTFKRKMRDPEWRERELARHRIKSVKARKNGTVSKRLRVTSSDWDKRNPHKKKAHASVNNGIRDGKINPKPCEKCGSKNSQAHHDDYSKSLDVIWLCPRHHSDRHIELRQIREYGKIITPIT